MFKQYVDAVLTSSPAHHTDMFRTYFANKRYIANIKTFTVYKQSTKPHVPASTQSKVVIFMSVTTQLDSNTSYSSVIVNITLPPCGQIQHAHQDPVSVFIQTVTEKK